MHSTHSHTTSRLPGVIASWAACLLGIAYVLTTILGLRSLGSPAEPIGEPYFALMEILTLLIAPAMAISLAAVHGYAAPADKLYSRTAMAFMFLMAGITSGVHFVVLTVGRQLEPAQLTEYAWVFSFTWPSVVYALDILAWDWFFALAMLFAAPVFKGGKLERILRLLMIVAGVLSLAGLIGVPLANMQVRNIGILGYAVVAPFVFLLIGMVLRRNSSVEE